MLKRKAALHAFASKWTHALVRVFSSWQWVKVLIENRIIIPGEALAFLNSSHSPLSRTELHKCVMPTLTVLFPAWLHGTHWLTYQQPKTRMKLITFINTQGCDIFKSCWFFEHVFLVHCGDKASWCLVHTRSATVWMLLVRFHSYMSPLHPNHSDSPCIMTGRTFHSSVTTCFKATRV